MYFSLGEVVALLAFGGFCVYMLAATRIRELALQQVKLASRRHDFAQGKIHIHSLLFRAWLRKRVTIPLNSAGCWACSQ